MRNILICSLLFAALLTSGQLNAQYTAELSSAKTFPFEDGFELDLRNEFGDVVINHWEKDSIKIEFEIIAEAKERKDARELRDRIAIEVYEVYSGVLVETALEKAKKNWIKGLWEINEVFGRRNVTVNYTINLPANSRLKINNKYGDIILPDEVQRLGIHLKYGDIRGGAVVFPSTIEQTQGKLILASYTGSLKTRNVRVKIGQSEEINIQSTNSEIDIEECKLINLRSDHDVVELYNVGRLIGSFTNSDVTVDHIKESINGHAKNSDLDFRQLHPGMSLIELNEKSSTIEFGNLLKTYDLYFKMEEGIVKLPSTVQNLHVNLIDDKKNIREVKAHTSQGGLLVNITGLKGKIFFK